MQLPARTSRSRNNASRAIPLKRARFSLICLLFIFWALAISARLFWLQIVQHKGYLERAERQQLRTFEVAPRRGVLYDRNLRELAMTVQADSYYAVPSEIDDKQKASWIQSTAHTLAAVVHTDPEDAATSEAQIAERLTNGRSFAWIARRVTPGVSKQVKDLGIKGVYSQKEFERSYPENLIAAQVLGYVGVDDTGLGGLEQKYEPQLHGAPGRMYTALDARRKVLGSSEREPEPGQNLVLTIDEEIQYFAERALDHVMEKTQADNGTVVVQDVHTGQILALAIRPSFNPNDSRKTTPALLKNHAVSDVYEPGSVFKLVTYSAALEQHVTTPDDMIDCQGGAMALPGRIIHDDKADHYGVITVHEALEHSSDVAAVKLAQKIGQDKFYEYIRSFGFGARTGLELPGETRGLLQPTKRWGTTSYASIAIGQEVGVTPLQLVSMVSTIANGGVYLPPHVLMPGQVDGGPHVANAPVATPFKPGGELPIPLPAGAHRVLSEMTAAQMRKMMEGVVLYGTGKVAQLNGFSSGGKTGTAQKIDPATHTYSKTMHIASFAGIAPVNNPVISVAVVIDNPHGASYYGAAVSAPVFAEVAQQVLEYLGVQHDIDVRTQPAKQKVQPNIAEDDTQNQSDVNTMFAAINDLPSDDPLRAPPVAAAAPIHAPAQPVTQSLNKPVSPEAKTPGNNSQAGSAVQLAASTQETPAYKKASHSVTLSDAKKLKVPLLVGLPMRQVLVVANAAGLEVQISGSGTVRQQAPAAGTMVAAGTQIAVRCGR
jgi:cell division protein FtsI (penicillin-binding protein 3)